VLLCKAGGGRAPELADDGFPQNLSPRVVDESVAPISAASSQLASHRPNLRIPVDQCHHVTLEQPPVLFIFKIRLIGFKRIMRTRRELFHSSNMLNRKFFVHWFEKHGRAFPWRRASISPYAVMVTEILLRQTPAVSVAGIWKAFFCKYQNITDLARADKKRLTQFIAILGFGKMRSSALISAAKWIVQRYNGQIPADRSALLEIPHIGVYSANALLCFAFKQRVEIVDTNVQRFFSRYYSLDVKPDIRRNLIIWEIAKASLPGDKTLTKKHNYGLLDFAGEVCKAIKPRCSICPLVYSCKYGKRAIYKL